MSQPASDFGTSVTAQQFSKSLLKNVYRKTFLKDVTNRDYETPGNDDPKSTKSIKSMNQKFTITSLFSNGWSTYSGSDLSFTAVKEVVSTLTIDTFKALQDKVMSLSAFKSSVTDPDSAVIDSAAQKLRVILQKAVLAMYADAGAGNWIGTSYTTGTVTVTVTTGAVTGSGTTFTSGMVGKPFKAAGHSKWYRVKTYSSATSIVIENDSDDETSQYDGGAIGAGAAYEIQANTKLAITSATIAGYLAQASQMLDDASYGDHDEVIVPEDGRFILLPAAAKATLVQASNFNRDIEMTYKDTVVEGKVGRAYGLDIILAKTTWFQGDSSAGYWCIFGQKSWLTCGMGFVDPVNLIPAKDNQTNFGNLIKGLFGYGFKVADTRRMCGGVLYATFSVS